MNNRSGFVLVLSAGLASTSAAQAPATASAGPVRHLGPTIAASAEALGSLAAMRQLSNGNVLVNDQVSRRVLMLDSALNLVRIVADSTPSTGNAYGGRSGGLFAFRGDSSLFVDPSSLSLLVIDPAGKLARTMAAPRPNEVGLLVGGNQATPGFDARGRLISRGGRGTSGPTDLRVDPTYPDTNTLVRIDLSTRKLDTVSFFKVQKTVVNIVRDADGGIKSMSVLLNNILPVVDEWAVMTDGSIAIVRGRDYHVDFYDADNAVTRGPKLAYDWERLNDEQKVAIIDSTRAFREKQRSQTVSTTTSTSNGRVVENRVDIVEGSAKAVSSGAPSAAPVASVSAVMPLGLPNASELPDYRPAFGIAGVRADMENHIWVRTTAVLQSGGGAIYDVIDRTGKRVDRVQVPVGVTIAGFGPGGAVYYGMRDSTGVHLKKARSK